MSAVLLSAARTEANVGTFTLLAQRNYAITDIGINYTSVQTLAAGGYTFVADLETTGGSGPTTTPFFRAAYFNTQPAAGVFPINYNFERSYSSVLILPAGCVINWNITAFNNISLFTVQIDIAGYTY